MVSSLVLKGTSTFSPDIDVIPTTLLKASIGTLGTNLQNRGYVGPTERRSKSSGRTFACHAGSPGSIPGPAVNY